MASARNPDPLSIRQLTPSDDRSAFTSGNESLDRYFRLYAGQNQFRHHLGVTYVAVASGQITGFMTVAPGELGAESRPQGMPILRLARLAVHVNAQRAGLGKALLFEALRLAVVMKTSVGCAGVVVDAKTDAVPFYSRYGFIAFDAFVGALPQRPPTTPMFLAVRKIEAALGSRTQPPRKGSR